MLVNWKRSITWIYIFNSLKRNEPVWGYYPNPTKIMMIVNPDNPEVVKCFSMIFWFKVFTGTRYLGGYIRDDEYKHKWLKKWTDKWKINIHAVTKMAGSCDPIGVYTFATHEKRYRTSVCGSVKGSSGNLFDSFFIWKTEKPLSRCRDYKYVSGGKIRYGTT